MRKHDIKSNTHPATWGSSLLAAFSFVTCMLLFAPQVHAAWVGFQASLKSDVNVKATGIHAIGGWQTSGAKGLFQVGTSFNETTGVFTAPFAGYYHCSGQVVFRNAEAGAASRWNRLMFAINGNTNTAVRGGLHTLMGPIDRNEVTLTTSGTVYLAKDHKIALLAFSHADNNYTLGKESGMGCYFINTTLAHGFLVEMNVAQSVTTKSRTGINKPPTTYKKTGQPGLFQAGSSLDLASGVWTVPVDGYYHVSARTRLDQQTSKWAHLSLFTSNNAVNLGLTSMITQSGNYNSAHVSGTVFLKKGATVVPSITTENDSNYTINLESGFSAHLLSTTKIKGFHADLIGSKGIAVSTYNNSANRLVQGVSGWYPVKGWYAPTNGTVVFSSGSAFNANEGIYTVPETGYYHISGQLNIYNCNDQTGTNRVKTAVVINGKYEPANGLNFAWTNPTLQYYSTPINGVLKLNKGDTVRLWFHSSHDKDFWIFDWSGLSIAMIRGIDTDFDGVPDELDCRYRDAKSYPAYKGFKAAPELCDGIDNDCDGKPEKVGAVCTVTRFQGPCAKGKIACDANNRTYCKPDTTSMFEVCDGIDNNCDGKVDNIPFIGQNCSHPTNQGACQPGKWACENNKKICKPNLAAKDEACTGQDDNCDGIVDNIKDVGKPCTDSTRKGECQAGFWGCKNNQKVCIQGKATTVEECSGKDDNCDGMVDNIRDAGTACQDRTKQGQCQLGTWGCQNNRKVCTSNTTSTTEICNNKDDDCNGKIDDLPELGKTCQNAALFGPCRDGVWACVKSAKVCQTSTKPTTETCNGKDDDCNGKIDDVAGLGQICKAPQQKGECQAGTWVCKNDQRVCQSTVKASKEVCDGLDNDCDGLADNGIECQQKAPCQIDEDCQQNEICAKGKCQPNTCDKVTCQAGKFCRGGRCIASCGCKKCPQGQSCQDGVCNSDPCAGVACSQGQVCQSFTGQCVADPCASVTCKAGEVCRGGSCVVAPCANVKCFGGEVCYEGQCYTKSCVPQTPTPREVPSTPDAGPPRDQTPPNIGCDATSHTQPPWFLLFLLLLWPLRRAGQPKTSH